jgi:hypothetical protein
MNPTEQEKRNTGGYVLMAVPAVLIIAVIGLTVYAFNKA